MDDNKRDVVIHFSWDNYPKLIEELDIARNKGILYRGRPIHALGLSCHTKKKLDWKCSTCDHEWKAAGDSRTRGRGCPACSNQRIHSDGRNSMENTHPELAKEYQGEPSKIIAGTKKKLDWKCSTCDHEWKAVGASRVQGNGCPACSGRIVHTDGRNSMENMHPELAKEYQGDASKIVAGTNKKLDWKCSTCDHEWKAVGASRKEGSGCPACLNRAIHSDGRNSMENTHPELTIEYQGDASKIIAGTHTRLDWKCSTCDHEWKAAGDSRSRGGGCPACSNKAIHSDGRNSMENTHPELAKEYQGDASKIIASTHTRLDWKCSTCEHEWKTSGKNRKEGSGCPFCAPNSCLHSDGRNSMENTHPELAIEYQGDASIIVAGTGKRLDWKCSTCDHLWKTTGHSRYHHGGCRACLNLTIHSDGINSMENTHPELAIEYQGDASKIIAGTHTRLDWKCSTCEHEWKTSGLNRTQGTGCSFCAEKCLHSDGRNSMGNTHPELANEYQGDASKIVAGTSTRLDWKCSTCDHEWKAVGSNRVQGTGCPDCTEYGYDKTKPGQYYVIRILNRSGDTILYKGGISNNYKKRIKQHKAKFKDHHRSKKWQLHLDEVVRFEDGNRAWVLERKLLGTKIRSNKISGLSSELFDSNPLDCARENGWL